MKIKLAVGLDRAAGKKGKTIGFPVPVRSKVGVRLSPALLVLRYLVTDCPGYDVNRVQLSQWESCEPFGNLALLAGKSLADLRSVLRYVTWGIWLGCVSVPGIGVSYRYHRSSAHCYSCKYHVILDWSAWSPGYSCFRRQTRISTGLFLESMSQRLCLFLC